ncbi:SsgA family sporulation/cell division regulator [Streptomyces jeddahensis]|uniref:Sporulation and cell division protein n=1 Tax=Streptomyces jeddahensis TaxID=1716141 RepID=A0A177HU33_9ACTN|nr:SsgA family sporulation/cell division regulator [Streptomyces jeddahensis]OAH14385.1 hypothetical protein STSP_22690 [Streptomyces jeddahensis]
MSIPSLPDQGMCPFGKDITVALFVKMILSSTEAVPLPARFVYDACQPYSVRLEFPHPDGDDVTRWVFARELLDAGLRRRVGEGDIRIWPPCRCCGRVDIRLLLCGTTGSALVAEPRRPLQEWLERTWEAVPPGKESALIDWDSAFQGLFP